LYNVLLAPNKNSLGLEIRLCEVVKTAKEAAISAKEKNDPNLLFAYHDILDVIKTQAEVMEVPLDEIGLSGVDLDELLQAMVTMQGSQKQAA